LIKGLKALITSSKSPDLWSGFFTSVKIFKRFPNLKAQKFWGAGLWSKGYYVGTAGTVTSETIQKYIDEQKTRN
jgi:putative transposase